MNDNLMGPGSRAATLVERAKAIVLKPRETWPIIAAEPATPGDLITSYALPLAAIGPIAGFIGGQIFGYGGFGVKFSPSFTSGLTIAIFGFIMAIVAVVVLGLVADWLAPKFGGQASRSNAFKLAVYAMTAGWAGGIFGLIPALGVLGLLASLYSIYLFYSGATPVMKVPQDKAAGYVAVTAICAIALNIVAGMLTAPVMRLTGTGIVPTLTETDPEISGKLAIPGMGEIDLDKAQKAADEMKSAANGETKATDPARLLALIPAGVGSFTRSATETNALGGMGSEAKGTFTANDKSFTLRVADMGALGALAALGSAAGVSSTREDANGYEKTGTVDGRLQSEEWRKSGSGKFMIVVANRFIVEAEGSANSIDELKAAVASISEASLKNIAN